MELPPEIIDGKYRVISHLGGGGFSEVYLVEGPNKEVSALKLLKETAMSSKEGALDEFKNEFSILKDINHPNIAGILDFGLDEKDNRYYYTSEYIQGTDFLKATDKMGWEGISDLIVEALRALEYLHSYQIHHFDIKAANLLVISDHTSALKIIDFGLAGVDPRGRMIGTPSYMAPEIVMREPADGRADLYSLGVLWYAALVRTNPFRALTRDETLSRQIRLIPDPPSLVRQGIPQWSDPIIMRLLEKNPTDRFVNAAAVIREINRLGPKKYPLETPTTLLSYIPQEGRFIGRADEIASLERAVADLGIQPGSAQCWLITGAPGTGKTRIIRELKYRLQLKDLRVLIVQATQTCDLLTWCDALSSHLSGGKGLQVFILDDANEVIKDEATGSRLLTLFYKVGRPHSESSTLIVVGMRDDPELPNLPFLEAVHPNRIEMKAFSEMEITQYLCSLTGLSEPPVSLLDGIIRRTEGNPLFVTEVIKSLIAGGGLFDEHGRWKKFLFEDVGVDFSKVIVSDTVSDLLMDRFEKLSDGEKKLLATLAIAGRPANAAQLGNWGEISDPHTHIAGLVRLGILERCEGFEVRFQNALMGEVISKAIPQKDRAALHDRMAKSLEDTGAPLEDVLLHRAQGPDKAIALDAWTRLGDNALAKGRGRQAVEFIGEALKLVGPEDTQASIGLKMKIGEAYLIGHDYTAARETFVFVGESLASGAPTSLASEWKIDMLMRLGGTYIKLQELGRAKEVFEDAKALVQTAGRPTSRGIMIANFIAEILFQQGSLEEARRMFDETRRKAKELDESSEAKVTNNDLGMVLAAMRDTDGAERILREDLAKAESLMDDLLIGRAHYNLAQVALARSDIHSAIRAFERCSEICKRSNNTELLMRAYNGLGNAYHISQDHTQGIEYYERGLDLHERVHDFRGGAAIAINVGIIEASRGSLDAALDKIIPAVEYLKTLQETTTADLMALSRGLLEIGDINLKKGERVRARTCLEEALLVADKMTDAVSQRFWILSVLGEVACADAKYDECAKIIETIEPIASNDEERKKLEELKLNLNQCKEGVGIEKVGVWPPKVSEPPQYDKGPYARILEINKLIAGKADVDYVLKTVLHYALELAEAEAGAVLLLDDEGKLGVASSQNIGGSEGENEFSRTLARHAIESGCAVCTDDAASDERFETEASICSMGLRSVLCLPVNAHGRTIGAIYLENRHEVGAFATTDVSLMEAFGDQVGLAIDASRVRQASEAREENLKSELSDTSRRAEIYKELLEKSRSSEVELELGAIVAVSGAMKRVLHTMEKIADTDISVFICGESGTGKELVARALHSNHTGRKDKKFVAINCGAIPATLIESELFGYKSGAFTGAARDKKGLIEEANGGTLFLDEVGELDTSLQVKLLRVLEERELTKLGAVTPLAIDVRVVAASNRDIDELVREGKFREDLYYRICQMKIILPPLRERPEDIVALARRFVKDVAGERKLSLHPRFMRRLMSYDWPGNVRELLNLIHVACALAEGDVIDERAIPENHPIGKTGGAHRLEALPPAGPKRDAGRGDILARASNIDDANVYDPSKTWRDYEKVIVAKCYEANGFKPRPSAAELGISVATFYSRINEWGLKAQDNPVYKDPFRYTRGRKVDDYLGFVFSAALLASGGMPTAAIANLRVSQGYFYKVMRKAKMEK